MSPKKLKKRRASATNRGSNSQEPTQNSVGTSMTATSIPRHRQRANVEKSAPIKSRKIVFKVRPIDDEVIDSDIWAVWASIHKKSALG